MAFTETALEPTRCDSFHCLPVWVGIEGEDSEGEKLQIPMLDL